MKNRTVPYHKIIEVLQKNKSASMDEESVIFSSILESVMLQAKHMKNEYFLQDFSVGWILVEIKQRLTKKDMLQNEKIIQLLDTIKNQLSND
jgi:hypothetical protein